MKKLIYITLLFLTTISYAEFGTKVSGKTQIKEGNNTIGSVILSTATAFKSTSFNSLVVDNLVDSYNQQGKYFEASHLFQDVPDNGYIHFYWVNSSTVVSHVKFNIDAEGKAYITGYKNPVVASSGTLYTTTTKNFGVNNSPSDKVYYNPTVTSSGTALFYDVVWGGGGPKSVGEANEESTEWITPAGSYFMGVVQNKGGAAKDINIRIFWYEVEQ